MKPDLDFVEKATVLVVDDTPDNLSLMSGLLKDEYKVKVANNGEKALKIAQSDNPPDLILLDIMMPGMDGYEVCQRLKGDPQTNSIPVIFLTGHADVATAVDAVKRGAFDFCEKPFSDNALVDRIEQALNLSSATLARHAERDRLRARMADLTERERDVMQRVAQGLPNKLIADALDISVRTVEVHRARVFDKMGVKSAVDLVHLLQEQ